MQNVLIQVFGLLVAAVLFVWFFKRIGLPPILAYLTTGVLAGSHGIGWMAQSHEMHFVAELGIVFLLFSLGLEFSLHRLRAMRNIVFGQPTSPMNKYCDRVWTVSRRHTQIAKLQGIVAVMYTLVGVWILEITEIRRREKIGRFLGNSQ